MLISSIIGQMITNIDVSSIMLFQQLVGLAIIAKVVGSRI